MRFFLALMMLIVPAACCGCGANYMSEAETPIEEGGEVPPEEQQVPADAAPPENGEEPGV